MPRKDLYHQTVVAALLREGWTITDDPLRLVYGGRNLYVDLGAKRLLGAVKESRIIAVEVKSFIGSSDLTDLEMAIGQYNLYRDVLVEQEPERQIYLAVPRYAYDTTFSERLGQLVIKQQRLRLIVFGVEEGPLQWIE
jgi:hypothetical protein